MGEQIVATSHLGCSADSLPEQACHLSSFAWQANRRKNPQLVVF